MEIKAKLIKPYTEEERMDFIVKNNHENGYQIEELNNSLIAWGYNNDELLEKIKENKKEEATKKAYKYIENGALFEFEKGKHIEATDGNISKLGLMAIELFLNKDTKSTIEWCTYEDEVVNLNANELQNIVQGLKDEQARVWVELYHKFLQDIEIAQTIEEVNMIEINYEKLQKKVRSKKI